MRHITNDQLTSTLNHNNWQNIDAMSSWVLGLVLVCPNPTPKTMQSTLKDSNSVWEEREQPKPPLHISKPWQKLQSYIQQSMIIHWWKLYKIIQWQYEFVKQTMIIFELFTFQKNAAVFLDLSKDPSLELASVYIYTFISVKAASLPNCPST